MNDLLSMLYALFSGYISAVGDVGVGSTLSYSISSSLLLSVCRSLPPPLPPFYPEYSHQQIELFMAPLLCFLSFFFFRERNVRKHSKPGTVPVVSEREKHVVTVVK